MPGSISTDRLVLPQGDGVTVCRSDLGHSCKHDNVHAELCERSESDRAVQKPCASRSSFDTPLAIRQRLGMTTNGSWQQSRGMTTSY